MNKKTASVLICQNKLAKDNSIFLLHTREPTVLARVLDVSQFEIEIFNDFGNQLTEKDLHIIKVKMKKAFIAHKAAGYC